MNANLKLFYAANGNSLLQIYINGGLFHKTNQLLFEVGRLYNIFQTRYLFEALILKEQLNSAVEILLCFSLLPLGEVLSPTGSLSQVKHTPQTPVIGGKSLCVSDLLQSYQTKVGGRHGGWQGVSQVDPVEPAPRPELPKVGLKESVYTDLLFKVQDKVRYICDT